MFLKFVRYHPQFWKYFPKKKIIPLSDYFQFTHPGARPIPCFNATRCTVELQFRKMSMRISENVLSLTARYILAGFTSRQIRAEIFEKYLQPFSENIQNSLKYSIKNENKRCDYRLVTSAPWKIANPISLSA